MHKKQRHIRWWGLGLCASLFVATALVSFTHKQTQPPLAGETPVAKVLKVLGEEYPAHYLETTPEMVKQGEDLVLRGRTLLPNGKYSDYISKYYLCTDCHNIEREDPVLTDPNPDTRLPYVVEKGLPFLQATTFWGIVNRESWYNDDYVKKYGELVYDANKSLRASTQLCAVECAQGRPLEQWEEDAIIAYYWSLQLTLGDLDLAEEERRKFEKAFVKGEDKPALVAELKSHYALRSPATFQDPLEDKATGYGLQGRPEVGALIYEHSCRHCHKEEGTSDFLLDYAPYTFKYLRKNMARDNIWSIYKIIRKGTYAMPGARPYMPHYPEEKMSNQQIEDLRAYIEQQAGKG